MTDTLQELLDAQSYLQEKMPTTHPSDLIQEFLTAEARAQGNTDGRRQADLDNAAKEITDFIQWNHKALLHEMVELEGETGWKPWADKDFVNLEEAKGEAIDMLHFLLNDFLVLGMDSSEVRERYKQKHAKNEARQEAGYDGVTTKCPGCNRALDDNITCQVRPHFRLGTHIGVIHCDVTGRAYPIFDAEALALTVAQLKETRA